MDEIKVEVIFGGKAKNTHYRIIKLKDGQVVKKVRVTPMGKYTAYWCMAVDLIKAGDDPELGVVSAATLSTKSPEYNSFNALFEGT